MPLLDLFDAFTSTGIALAVSGGIGLGIQKVIGIWFKPSYYTKGQ